jgi:hypothetical protein
MVGFDEQLKPYVSDESGKRRKDLPAPGARDDAELAPAARKRFADLKKDVRAVAADQIRRLEAAMTDQRRWSAAEFGDLFTRHPLMWHIVRRLVWVSETGGILTEFRVAEDRTLADVYDDALTLPASAQVGVAHPLQLGDRLAAWSEIFADYEILQPFPQLGRPVHALTEEEAAAGHLTRFEGRTVPIGKVLGLLRHGWERGIPQDAGVERWISRRVSADSHIVIELEPGIAVGVLDMFPEQTLQTVWLNDRPDDHWPHRANARRFGDLDEITASEVLADLTEVIS